LHILALVDFMTHLWVLQKPIQLIANSCNVGKREADARLVACNGEGVLHERRLRRRLSRRFMKHTFYGSIVLTAPDSLGITSRLSNIWCQWIFGSPGIRK